MCPKVIASSLYAISAYEEFHRNALLSHSRGKLCVCVSVCVCVCVMRTVKIYSLSHFQICSTVLITTVTMLRYHHLFIYRTAFIFLNGVEKVLDAEIT